VKNKTMSAYRFQPFTSAHLVMAERWLRTPEVVRWWGDLQRQIAPIREDLDEPLMQQWIVEYAARSIACLQSYPANPWPQAHLAHLPDGAGAIDTFIGELAMLAAPEQLLAEGAPVVAIDPARDNHRARRAFVRAGFSTGDLVQTEAGPAVLMLYCGQR
jgi:aminoglycoside 6'-N-acetyltransferase